jgi:hypothetical protein
MSHGFPGYYSLPEMHRDSSRTLAGYRRRQKGEPDIDSTKLADTIAQAAV